MAATLAMEARQPTGGGMSVATFGTTGIMVDSYHGAGVDGAESLTNGNAYNYSIPSEASLTLLCLDYLRDLVRSCPAESLKKEGLEPDWLLIATYALQQSLSTHKELKDHHDAWKTTDTTTAATTNNIHHLNVNHRLPPLKEIQKMLLEDNSSSLANTNTNGEDPSQPPQSSSNTDPADIPLSSSSGPTTTSMIDWYDMYDDTHSSNQHRLYPMNGLASRPLFLGELVTLACSSNNLRTRRAAQQEMVQSPLFEQFLRAVESKGFFKNSSSPDLYQERYQKVVAKFRTKLASKSEGAGVDRSELLWERHQQRRLQLNEQVAALQQGGSSADPPASKPASESGELLINTSAPTTGVPPASPSPRSLVHNPADLEQAEALKTQGNAAMQRKQYQAAAEAYTAALKLSPDGPNSHVYFSNRAAALLSQKEFQKAILDSERALKLKPNYGKAHARLGLAHFLLGDYRQAMEAYTVALKYEPDNKSSKSYLEKAAKRLAAMGTKGDGPTPIPEDETNDGITPASFSVVSEWDKSKTRRQGAADGNAQVTTPEALREAEKYKVRGNQYMANREYDNALACYSQAIDKSPQGPQSHVYYSNRAAALCYLERYQDAAKDSTRAIQLQPTYGKAFARLGLSRFFLEDFEGAMDAYEQALVYDPDNAASKSYLAKAKLKLETKRSGGKSSMKEDVAKDARRLMEDPDMQYMAKKALEAKHKPQTAHDLLEDPEMQRIAGKAMNDPTMMQAVMAASSASSTGHNRKHV